MEATGSEQVESILRATGQIVKSRQFDRGVVAKEDQRTTCFEERQGVRQRSVTFFGELIALAHKTCVRWIQFESTLIERQPLLAPSRQ